MNYELGIRNKTEKKSGSNKQDSKLQTLVHKTIKKVGEDIEAMRFNTAVSAMMVLTNEMEKSASLTKEQYSVLLRLLAPFAPHITNELWSILGHRKSIHVEPWCVFDPALLVTAMKKLVVQVNSKVRATLEIETEVGEERIKGAAMALPEIKKWVENKIVKRVVYVRDRLVNVVV